MRKLDVVAQGRTLGIIIQKTVAFYIAKPPGRVRDLKVEISGILREFAGI